MKGCFRCRILQEYLAVEAIPFRVFFFCPFPFSCAKMEQLSQELFNITDGNIYNQTLILNNNYEVDPGLLAQQGLVCCLFDLKVVDLVLAIVWCSHIMQEPGSFICSPRTLGWGLPLAIY